MNNIHIQRIKYYGSSRTLHWKRYCLPRDSDPVTILLIGYVLYEYAIVLISIITATHDKIHSNNFIT